MPVKIVRNSIAKWNMETFINLDEVHEDDEEKLRACYRNALRLAEEQSVSSVAFPLISTGGFGYPKEEGMRIALDEINAFLLNHDMLIYLVVFGEKATALGEKLYPDLEEYIDSNYVERKTREEYSECFVPNNERTESFKEGPRPRAGAAKKIFGLFRTERRKSESEPEEKTHGRPDMPGAGAGALPGAASASAGSPMASNPAMPLMPSAKFETLSAPAMAKPQKPDEEESEECAANEAAWLGFEEEHESKLAERMKHLSDTFSEYLLYLIHDKKMENAEVYKRAIVDKKIFSKIKNNPDYHPQKLTALCLCVGAKLNLDESKDLLARAGYALSPCDKTDIIFSYFIENKIYDMIELDIQLEEHGLPCIIA